MQAFVIKTFDPTNNTTSNEVFNIVREVVDYPKRYEIQSRNGEHVAEVTYDVVNEKGDWRLLKQEIVPNPLSLVGEKILEFVIVMNSNITIELITEEQVPFFVQIEDEVVMNSEYRKVVSTGPNLQVVYQTLLPGVEIGSEIHLSTDQFFHIVEGDGKAEVTTAKAKYSYELHPGISFHIYAGMKHNIINTGSVPLKLYTIYGGKTLHDAGLTERLKPTDD